MAIARLAFVYAWVALLLVTLALSVPDPGEARWDREPVPQLPVVDGPVQTIMLEVR